ncbi:caspase family protein [Paraburkholderia graminis]|uniref:caspase family protein n=1 Tax=Paraburkholderia graminis TaxID=60548 RepID=UPI00278DB9CC|nr:caspase family protein [Paraburkholderia graminis]MDQ0627121.1 hypothetical protein [Paraburkholderia graminis]
MPEPPTCAIFIGASKFPRHKYGTEPAFLRSKREFEKCIREGADLSISEDGLLDLFDSNDPASDQLGRIGKFLVEYSEYHTADIPRNLIVYYVGHGYFYGRNQDYMVALASTDSENESSGLRVGDLADTINKNAKDFRRFVILDCCFAAEALRAFQAEGEHVVARKAAKAFATDSLPSALRVPIRGTAMLCASSKDDFALSIGENGCTMFSGALVKSLNDGDWRYGPRLTTIDLFELIEARLEKVHGEHVRPELHSPDQSNGNIAALVGLFANRVTQQSDQRIFNPKNATGTYFGPTQRGYFVRQDEVFGRPTVQNLAAILAIAVSFVLFVIWGHARHVRILWIFFVPFLVFSCCSFAVINSRNFVEAIIISSMALAGLLFLSLLFDAPFAPIHLVFFLFAASVPVCALFVLVVAILRPHCRRLWRHVKELGRA